MSEKLPWTKVENGITYELVGGRYVPQRDYSDIIFKNREDDDEEPERKYPVIKRGYALNAINWISENRPWVLYDKINGDRADLEEFAKELNAIGAEFDSSVKQDRQSLIEQGYDRYSADSVANEYAQSDLDFYLRGIYTDELDPNGYFYYITYPQYPDEDFPVPERQGKYEDDFDDFDEEDEAEIDEFIRWYENVYKGKNLAYDKQEEISKYKEEHPDVFSSDDPTLPW